MISRERSGKSFPLGSPATLTTSSHCWRKRPISSPSALSFTRTLSTARRQENSRTRFTRYKQHLLPHQRSQDQFVHFHNCCYFWGLMAGMKLNSKLYQTFVFAVFAPGWYHLPRIPRVPRAPADLPHVVHRDCQLHRRRRRSLGLLSCVSALLNWHHTPPTHTLLYAHPYPRAFFVSLKNKALLCGACGQLPGQFDYISPVGELLIRQELPLCQRPFSDFSGARAE